MASIKQKRLEGIIRKDISDIIQFDLKDPDVGFVTITDVKVSSDHSYATVYVTFLGQSPRAQAGLRALNRARGFIRSQLSQMLDIRRTPELTFKLDTAMENGRHIDEIIAKIHQEEAESKTDNGNEEQ
ncbi:MAG: 30S ribosome-binding factor RbfA [Solobacterium sp.]|nr:30S ribosome-binding factor RbfA [Erysipelotrichaceae bacterium]MBQ9153948.1 30S ribosome-binding factor RbfA [Solobacterium sp.]